MTIEARPAIFGMMPIPIGSVREFLANERLSVVAKGSSIVEKLEVSVDKDGLINSEGQKLNHFSGVGALRKPMLYRGQINEAHLRLAPSNSEQRRNRTTSDIWQRVKLSVFPEMVHWRKTA